MMVLKLKKAGFNTAQVCRCLAISRPRYYQRIKPKPIDIQHTKLIANLRYIYAKLDAVYRSM